MAVIGNAPTALFRLLELVARRRRPDRPPSLGIPVGFVGAAESKEALATLDHGIPYLTVHGRRGGSAMAAAARQRPGQHAGSDAATSRRPPTTGSGGRGHLFGVGVGPGDPELMTLKARRIIERLRRRRPLRGPRPAGQRVDRSSSR